MKFMITLLSFLAFLKIYALPPNTPNISTFNQEGNLVSIRLEVGEPLRIFVIGKEEAKLDLSSLKLTVRRITPYPARILQLNPEDNYFTVSEPMNLEKGAVLEVTAQIHKRKEKFQFNIKPTPLH